MGRGRETYHKRRRERAKRSAGFDFEVSGFSEEL